jgi:hypothetical protein
MSHPSLFADVEITVHCFACPHTVKALDPYTAHDRMERHYADRHGLLIARLVGEVVA